MTDEFDPDRPVPGDPPIDARSMLDVIADHRVRTQQQLEAAQKMIIPYAIRAILDGEDVLEVAAMCGFLGNVTIEDEGVVMVDVSTGRVVGRPPSSTREEFANWLCQHLFNLITGRTPG